ncbi:MAG: NAD(+)/NADH kinase [Verrucomicrobia bacterium]|nr:NAD(+)/NADH kinase [Verrucomicrobiota bacterium]
MSAQITTVGLAINPDKKLARQLAREATALLKRAGVRVLSARGDVAGLAARSQMLLVFGGDGTMLRLAREMNGAQTPVLGINAGALGFLTVVPAEGMEKALRAVLAGRYTLRARAMLKMDIVRRERWLPAHYALNDVVISRGAAARIVRMAVGIDGEPLTEYVCDGMIFATQTGSTAYSMSAGGPILTPGTEAFVMTPICPHSLTNRSVVVGRSAVVETRILSQPEELVLTVDGQVRVSLRSADTIHVRRGNRLFQLVQPEGYSYYETLRRKLNWSGANV